MADTIIGTYNKTLFRNEKNDFTYFTVITKSFDQHKNNRGELFCSGIIPVYAKGMPLEITGDIILIKNKSVFEVNCIKECSNERKTTIMYLSSGIVDGIGEKIAEKIVDVTGPDIFSFIKRPDARERLESIERINAEKVTQLIKTINTTVFQKNVYEYITKFGGNYTQASELYALYGENCIEKLEENSYKYGMEAGLSFYTCDSIAKYNKKTSNPYDEDRISALLIFVMKTLVGNGHVYANMDNIVSLANYIIRSSAYIDKIPRYLLVRAAIKCREIVIEKTPVPRYYLRYIWNEETTIIQNVNRISNSKKTLCFDESIIDECSDEIEYSEKQKESFLFLKTTGIKILTGGPGTGKTTVINGIIKAYEKMYPHNIVSLCAPTGRAAQRMSESTGMQAYTIHRLLEIRPYDKEMCYRNSAEPLSADLLIVDEVSMIDERIFSVLLSAVKDDVIIILCGDADQLSSVGEGNVLKDLIDSNRFEVNTLDIIYRQSNGSDIIYNANAVNTGNTDLRTGKYFSILEVDSEQKIHDVIVDLAEKRFDMNNPQSVQVLSSIKRGIAGINNLNRSLQNICNPAPNVMAYGHNSYRINDKVIMTQNNYTIGYINGDLGTIVDIDKQYMVIEINNENVTIPKSCYCDIALAYAMTVHKSQGSEYTTVIISLLNEPAVMLKRNLLYTAITRAKKEVIIVTQKGAVNKAISTLDDSLRNTALKEKLNGKIPEIVFKTNYF